MNELDLNHKAIERRIPNMYFTSKVKNKETDIQFENTTEAIVMLSEPNPEDHLKILMAASTELVRHYVSTNKTPPEILIALRVRLRMTHQEVNRLRQL